MSAHPDIEDSHKVVCVKRSPQGVDVEAGKSYWWCSCGRSKNQPFCDGSHKGTSSTPIEYKAEKTEKVWFCMCRQTAAKPLCDGSHKGVAPDAEGRLLPCRACVVESPHAPASSAQLAFG
jgi:CDGSH-type Zn-finger protein